MLRRMYLRLVREEGFKAELMERSRARWAGIKSATI